MIESLIKERAPHEEKPNIPKKETVETESRESGTRESLPHDTIADLFHDRDKSPADAKNSKSPARRPQEQDASKEGTQEAVGDDSGEEDVNSSAVPRKEATSKDATSKQETQVEIQTLKEELEKTHKRLVENQQYGRQNAQRLKNALKLTKAFVEEGSLSEEEAIKLMGSLEHDDEADAYTHPTHPFGKVLATANKELDNIRKYTDDDHLDDKVAAFDYFLMVSSPEEREQALENLTDLMDNPLTLAKKMLSIGQDHAPYYRDMKEAGSLHGLITKKDQDILNLRKNLDKLTKKLAQFEDYDKPRYRIDDHVGEMSGLEEDALPKDTISSLFHHRDAIRNTVTGR